MFEWVLRGLALLAEIVLAYLFYSAGWLALRLLTLGRYPRLPLRPADPTGARSTWVAAFGCACLLGPPLIYLTAAYS